MVKENLCTGCKCILHEGSNWHESFVKKSMYLCIKCLKKKNQGVYKERKEAIKKSAMELYEEYKSNGSYGYGEKKWASRYLSHIRMRDRARGSGVCDLKTEEFLELIKKPCCYCGSTNIKIGLDRIDNLIGHIKENIVPCCRICNTNRMATFTHEEMKILGKTIKIIIEKREES